MDQGDVVSFDHTGRLRGVFARIARFVAEGEVNGAALAVAVAGEPVALGFWGTARPGQAAGPATLWPLASISKVYTAATVMALVERGVLTLSLPVHALLPRFTGDGREAVTLRHLLTHTSGLIYESPEMEETLLRKTPLDAIVDEALTHPLQFQPGSRFGYSDYGIALAARVASLATGRPFPDLMRELVLEPAGLTDTVFPPPPALYPRVATVAGVLAEGTDAAMYNSPYALALAHPAFGVVASVEDLLRFGLLFRPGAGHRILAEATVRAMTTDQTGGEARGSLLGVGGDGPVPWGLGFALNRPTGQVGFGDLCSPRAFGHPGASGCVVVVDPDHDVALAFVSNRHLNADAQRWIFRLSVVVNGVLAALTARDD
ncbi:MAG: serine hydrolase domain-containing protein [Sphaerobacter sp.]|nr:serine hydrolase domain-containing protein [Sphaerobacter sp.]